MDTKYAYEERCFSTDSCERISDIYKDYHRLITSVALKVYRDSCYAQDVLQDTMLKILQSSVLQRLDNMNNQEHLKNYIVRIARCRAVDRYNELIQDKDTISLETCYDSTGINCKWDLSTHYEDSIECKERIYLIIECIESLPDIYSQVIKDKVFGHLDTTYIASAYGITEASVRKRFQRARKLLMNKLVQVRIIEERECRKFGY